VSIALSQTASLWAKGGGVCVCQTLRRGADYLVMGHEDVTLKRLLFDSNSVTEPWKKNWPKNLEASVVQ